MRQHPKTAAAFVRAIVQGQVIANRDVSAVQAAMARYDGLPPQVTAAIALTGYPVGPVVAASIERDATQMSRFGLLSGPAATEPGQRALIESMIAPGS